METTRPQTPGTHNGVQAYAPPAEVFNARSVVETLEELMHRVTEQEVTTATVNSACHCAGKIVDLLRLHLDAQRLQIQQRRHSAGEKE